MTAGGVPGGAVRTFIPAYAGMTIMAFGATPYRAVIPAEAGIHTASREHDRALAGREMVLRSAAGDNVANPARRLIAP